MDSNDTFTRFVRAETTLTGDLAEDTAVPEKNALDGKELFLTTSTEGCTPGVQGATRAEAGEPHAASVVGTEALHTTSVAGTGALHITSVVGTETLHTLSVAGTEALHPSSAAGTAEIHTDRGAVPPWEREGDSEELEKIWASLAVSPREHMRALTALRRSAPVSVIRILGDEMESLEDKGLLTVFQGDLHGLQAGVRRFVEGQGCKAEPRDHKKIGICYRKTYEGEMKTVLAEEAVYHFIEAGEVNMAAQIARELAEQYSDNRQLKDAFGLLNRIIALSPDPEHCERLLICRGNALCDLEKYEDARQDFEAAVESLGKREPDSPVRSIAFKGLATALSRLGLYSDAAKAYRGALEIEEKIFGGVNHAEYGALLHGLADTLVRLGHYNEAVSSYRASLTIKKKIHGDELHLEYAASLYGLAGALDNLGSYKEAVSTYRKGLAIQRQEFGTVEHPEYAASLGGLAASLAHLGSYKEAVQIYQQSLRIQKKVYGTDVHPEYAVSLNGLAGALDRLGSFKEAVDAYKKCLGIQKKAYGTEIHPEYAASLHGLANSLAHQGNRAEAGNAYSQALTIKKEIHGTECHPSILPTLANWGNTLATTGEIDAACEKLERAIEIAKKIDIPFHTGNILFLMAQVLRWKNPEKSERLSAEGQKILKKLLGPDHPLVRQIKSFLALLRGGIA